jgi:hypothetical protein
MESAILLILGFFQSDYGTKELGIVETNSLIMKDRRSRIASISQEYKSKFTDFLISFAIPFNVASAGLGVELSARVKTPLSFPYKSSFEAGGLFA